MFRKLLVPSGIFLGLISATFFNTNFDVYIVLICSFLISIMAFSPLDFVTKIFSPETRILFSVSIILMCSIFWIRNIQAIICIVFFSVVLTAFGIRFNNRLMQNYWFYITKRQQSVISNEQELKCFKSWDSKGKRECDTFLREYMHKSLAANDLEEIARPSYLIGFLTAQERFEHEDYAQIKEELKKAKNSLKNYKEDYSALCDKLNKNVDEINRLQTEKYELQHELWEIQKIEQIKKDKLEEKAKKVDTDELIIKLKADEPELSLKQIADKVGSTKSHVQYVLKRA